MGAIFYRDYKINRYWLPYARFEWSHEDYDGPGDRRYGHGKTIAECVREIDIVEDELKLDSIEIKPRRPGETCPFCEKSPLVLDEGEPQTWDSPEQPAFLYCEACDFDTNCIDYQDS